MFAAASKTASSSAANYIEDVFSTYLYTGNGSTQTITNGIDLSTKGGLVWMKGRSGATDHALYDTARGTTKDLVSNSTAAETTQSTGLTAFSSTGFSIGALAKLNTNAATYVSWAFRKQAKFFDVVTYTGNGANRTIAHNLGSVPGCIIVKRLDDVGNWAVWHRSGTQSNVYAAILNQTGGYADQGLPAFWGATGGTPDMNASTFSIGTSSNVNASGGTYVAYLFAHNAGGFGTSGADNVISCGSFTSTGSVLSVNLGYEPQWLLYKESSTTGDWKLIDNMRGFQVDRSGSTVALYPNLSSAESALGLVGPTSTGFTFDNGGSGVTYIYIAIRRGPMKTPTSGTSVFAPTAMSGTYAANTNYVTTGFPVDWTIDQYRLSGASQNYASTRLTNATLGTQVTSAESTAYGYSFASNTGMQSTSSYNTNNTVNWSLQRAPGFFDVVCYTGTGVGVTQTINHNLGVSPEMIIYKSRNNGGSVNWYNWLVLRSPNWGNYQILLNTTSAESGPGAGWPTTAPSSTQFYANAEINQTSNTYVAYLFASCPGVSKVGSYSGTGATQTISCGFAARFVMIKRTDSTGDWWVWDTSRGMVAGTDPRLALNSTAAESNANWVYTNASGFQIITTDATVNASGGSYIYLAIA